MKRLLALTLLLVMYALPAGAHSALVSSVPSANSTVVDFPMDVVLNFNEELMIVGDANPNKVEVFDEQGALISGESVVNGASVTAPVGINGNGTYSVKYRVVSKDGHVVEGNYSFNVESPIAISQPMPISAPAEELEDGPNLLVRLVPVLAMGLRRKAANVAADVTSRIDNRLFGSPLAGLSAAIPFPTKGVQRNIGKGLGAVLVPAAASAAGLGGLALGAIPGSMGVPGFTQGIDPEAYGSSNYLAM